jgi:hypothetical protein
MHGQQAFGNDHDPWGWRRVRVKLPRVSGGKLTTEKSQGSLPRFSARAGVTMRSTTAGMLSSRRFWIV